MSRITISDISVEQITEVSEIDAIAVVGGGEFASLLAGFATLGAKSSSDKLNAIVRLTEFGITNIFKL
jgi:enhancing lycopene biosynthesis protein 2